MKKLLLTLCALASLVANAQTTFSWTYADWDGVTVSSMKDDGTANTKGADVISYAKDGFTMTASKQTGGTVPTVYGGTGGVNDLRIYANGSLECGYTEAITGLEFNISTQGKKRLADITASVGTVTIDKDNAKVFWVGSATSVTFTVGEKATYGTDGSGKAGQFDIDNVVLYTGGAAPTVSGGDKTPAGISYSQGSKTITLGTEYEFPTFTNANGLAVTFSSSNTDVATIDANGNVTLTGTAGTTTIKATTEETDKYYAGLASYTLTVKEASSDSGEGGSGSGSGEVKTEVQLPYSETFESSIGSFTTDDVKLGDGLSYVWKWNSYKYMKASAYVSSKNIEAESWLVSPLIDLTNAKESKVSFSECVNKYFGDVTTEATVWIKENGGTWQQLSYTHPDVASGSSYSAFTDYTFDISAYDGKKVYVAFKYTSTSTTAGTWEVKNFKVEDATSRINAIEANDASSAAYNIAGQRVAASVKGLVIKAGKKYVNK